jgi:16S rRNA processing protein RimM
MYNLQSDKEKYFLLGRVIKTYSYRGELVILLATDNPQAYESIEMVFIDTEQSLVPWFIDKMSINQDLATIKFDDLDNLEKAREFVGREVYLPVEKISKPGESDIHFHDITGYKVIDVSHGNIGEVVEILDRTEQKIIRILKGEKEILIPMADELIDKIDKKGKVLYLNTPSGLIDLYLE